ncbi:iron-containing alcohol dehydrogenase [Bacillus sp. S/N-304-OC-R1]|uniref:iron-containing alcohol dehydrogenase n=1 Tax=Bacillus sp. S/N-304-OC-R1 TaxID=2758034 RepID=UPI001C8DDE21|nr:iron-containing alcohol dehydrogenase [Bacillus sp. S/N-304-OC-R1]MBY0121445.1 iron-containing alcohol dehydrogenase [Bacillus sp. S/N-304-OC-R1]
MEKQAVFRTPQTIIYGSGSFEKVGEEAALRGKKALIISDNMMEQLGYVSKCRGILQLHGVESVAYLGVATEPTDLYVSESLEIFVKEKCDVVISLGGGSCIDTAKAIVVLAVNGGYIGDYMGGKKIAANPPIPHIAIPTTAGTGSEATDATVITNTRNDVKMMIKQPAFMPAAAIVDPFLTCSSPKSITAATGVDALSHAIEAYLSRRSHPMTDTLALSAMNLIVKNIKNAYENGDDLSAREAMSLGSLQAGMAFSNASVCLVHGMSRPIGALFHVPHGYSNAMLLPAVLEYSKEACIDRLADLGRIFAGDSVGMSNEEGAHFAVASVKELCVALNIPNLKGWGIEEAAFQQAISKMASDAIASGSPGNNPRIPTHRELEELYRKCFNYQYNININVQ